MTTPVVDAANAREQIIDALKCIGVTAHPTTPRSPGSYDAWTVLIDIRPVTMCLAETDWMVYVALPAADQDTTVEVGDQLADAVCTALMQVAKVNHVRPARWQLAEGSGEIPVWQFDITL